VGNSIKGILHGEASSLLALALLLTTQPEQRMADQTKTLAVAKPNVGRFLLEGSKTATARSRRRQHTV
jgi:hypothetical protein